MTVNGFVGKILNVAREWIIWKKIKNIWQRAWLLVRYDSCEKQINGLWKLNSMSKKKKQRNKARKRQNKKWAKTNFN